MRRFAFLLCLLASACRGTEATPSEAATLAQSEAAAAASGHRLTGRVIDEAKVLSPAEEQSLGKASAALERATSDQLVIVTVPSLAKESIEHLAWALGTAWGVGQKGLDNGVLILVVPKERKVRVEVGKGLEGLLTDARAAEAVQAMMPGFRSGTYGAGISAGEDRIIGLLRSDPRRPQRKAT
jgi:uncharacterized protein